MTFRDLGKEWMEYATRDLSTARFILGMKPRPLEIICFHCQQAVEKSLKAYLALNGKELPRTHDLVKLSRSCAGINDGFNQFHPACERLNDFSVRTRYPSQNEISEEDVELAIKFAGEIFDFVNTEFAK